MKILRKYLTNNYFRVYYQLIAIKNTGGINYERKKY